ncbi:MAG: sugar-binding transcriptional regulator [Chloroflexi bacterium]|nr:sugar-binding transcriptional regulator [Chloroflexota bacterium]
MNRDDLLARVAWLYYVEELTQQEIGDRLNMPRVKVTRLLKQARDEGVVEFRIARPTAHLELERELRQHFGLQDAFVAPTPLQPARLRAALGEAAARYLQNLFRPGLVVGLGMGRTLAEIPRFVEPHSDGRCVFVEMVGGAGRSDLGFDTYNVSWRLAECCGGVAEHVFTPVVVESGEARAARLQDSQISATLERAAQSDVALVGIGNTGDDMVLYHLGCCDYAIVRDLRQRGAVGDIMGHFFDVQGQPVACPLDDRLIAISLDQLRAIPTVVAVAGGQDKTAAILGALRGKHASVLVTDMDTARAVLAKGRDAGPADAGGSDE